MGVGYHHVAIDRTRHIQPELELRNEETLGLGKDSQF
jgi:hypothetical protein